MTTLTKKEYFLPKLAEQVLKDVSVQYETEKTLTDDMLKTLHSVYGRILEEVTELLDDGKVTKYVIKNGSRHMFMVETLNEQYAVFSNINFCQCPTFREHVLNLPDQITCKHILTLELAKITGKVKTETITELQFVEYLNNFMCDVTGAPP